MPDEAPAPPAEPQFGPWHAFALFAIVLVTQIAFASVTVVVSLVVMELMGMHPFRVAATQKAVETAMAPATLVSVIGAGILTLFVGYLWAAPLKRVPGPSGLGWRSGTRLQQVTALVAGIALALLWALTVTALPHAPTEHLGPLAKMAASGPFPHAVFVVTAVLIAPPVEELIFRSLMLAGFTRGWGVARAGALTTVLFVALHLPETIHFPLAIVVITVLAVGLLMARLTTDSIVVAIIFHAAYNTGVAVLTFF